MGKPGAYELYRRGMRMLEAGNPAQAAVLLERAREPEVEKGSIREALGRAYFNYGQFEQAEKNFRLAIGIDPTNHYAYFGLALSLERLGRTAAAAGPIKLATAMYPNCDDYNKARARILS